MARKQIIATNRRARHDYFIEDTLEAGIVLHGHEVKSLREHRVSIQEAYAVVENGELWLRDMHIAPYSSIGAEKTDPRRPRKLLVKKSELRRIVGRVAERGYTLVPLSLYFNERGYAKVELGLARGKRKYDKREAIAERDYERRLRRLEGKEMP
ncbi:MAG: SsrA-binding protein SmpB [Armatimonadetes bacterium]|nr:SsrA-binding protein SmpB [Armatimonadota bacterium]